MKIAFIANKELSITGDREAQVQKLAERLAREGWEITLYAPSVSLTFSSGEVQGVRQVFVPDVKRYLPFVGHELLSTFHAIFQGFQIIHFASSESARLAPLVARLLSPSVRVIPAGKKNTAFFQGVEAENPGEGEARALRAWGLWPKRYILADALNDGNSVHYLIKAFLGLEEQNKVPNNYKLVVSGGGYSREYRQYLEVLAGGNNNVIFIQRHRTDKIRQALVSQAALYVSLSKGDETPEALLQAMAYGVMPMVSRETIGSTDVRAENRGSVAVALKDIESLKRDMAFYINRKTEAEAIGRTAKKYVEDFVSWDALAEQAKETYVQAVKTHTLKGYAVTHK